MRLHRFYIEQKVGNNEEIAISDADLIHQLVNVFRFKVGDMIIIFDGTGFEGKAEIISANKAEVVLSLAKPAVPVLAESPKEYHLTDRNFVSLYLSLIKKSNFELAAEKCTEIGVAEIHPVISERSEKKDLNIPRLEKIVKEACEQSGRLSLPEVFDITSLETAVLQAKKNNKMCVAFHTGELNCDSATKAESDDHDRVIVEKVAVFIGPEGGWTEKEMKLFMENNFQICSLGHNVLRAETAAITAVWEAFHRG
jgi:16S rRNA (uracil1498-N3)-methyltransferase